MEGLPQTDKECFIKQMELEVRLALSRVIDAVNAAPDGQWISASEKPVRDVMDMERSAENLFRASGLRLGEESFRQIIESEGKAILEVAQAEELPINWFARDCLTIDSTGKEVSRVYVSADGVMVPVTTQAEKDKRRQTVEKSRRGVKSRVGKG